MTPPLALALRALLLALAYLSGSVPYGLLVSRARGIDIREVGSGNIGATNVARGLGKAWALLVLLLDAAKGALPVLAARHLLGGGPLLVGLAALGAVLGHVFPLFLRFRGGKGVATSLGVFVAASPLSALAGVAVYLLLYAALRISSVGSLGLTLGVLGAELLLRTPRELLLCSAAICALVWAKHHENLRRLLHGQEGKV
jgi:acyl phosphate:glycerol-3-phosphate acyltransferase